MVEIIPGCKLNITRERKNKGLTTVDCWKAIRNYFLDDFAFGEYNIQTNGYIITRRKPVRRLENFPLRPNTWIRLVLSSQDDTFWLSYDTLWLSYDPLYHTTAKMYFLRT
jgi:hypothetical protein